MPTPVTAPYGSWASPITSDLIAAGSISLQDVLLDGDAVYWVEGRPQEGGRFVLVHRCADGTIADVNPAPLNARSRVHEYGGGGAVVADGVAYISHFADQRLYKLPPGTAAVALTPPPPDRTKPDACLRYADGRIDAARGLWVGVREDHTDATREAVNTVVAVDLAAGGPGVVLAGGSDFYSSPRVSPDGKQLAWLCWDHPNMPWAGTELWVAEYDGMSVSALVRVAGGPAVSVCQPEWAPDGRLYFVSDESGWWNLYRREADGKSTAVCPREAEFGRPAWNFGISTYAFLSDREAVCSYIEAGENKLARLDVVTGTLTPLQTPYTEFTALRAGGGKVVFRAGSGVTAAAVVVLDLATGATAVLRTSTPAAADPAVKPYLIPPRHVAFPTAGGKTAHGLYYPPHNPDFVPPTGEKPPLVVKCHGGPTSSASGTLNLGVQFWTSRGVAVIDVDYGGSTGYGRAYRDRLYRAWGVVDVADCAAAARHLVAEGLADPARVVITGGSAGGFTTLACLTAADPEVRGVFRAGGSHYGVSDLEALVRDTHKFESRYLDWLVGPLPAAKAVYEERAPVRHADRLSAPVAFFQGDEDRIVPPNQTEVMVDALRRKGLPVLYLLFGGEQHGFRRAANIQRALDAELYFYATLAFGVGLGFKPEG